MKGFPDAVWDPDRTGSDDFSVCLLNGVPFKYGSTTRRHTRFVQSLAYAPDGSVFASAGSDGQVFLYDGTTAEDKGAFSDSGAATAHDKGVFAVSFSRDGKKIATSSADKSVKLWDVESRKIVQTWTFDGDEVLQQQVVRARLRSGFSHHLGFTENETADVPACRATLSRAKSSSRSRSAATSTSSTSVPRRRLALCTVTKTQSLPFRPPNPTMTPSSRGIRPAGSWLRRQKTGFRNRSRGLDTRVWWWISFRRGLDNSFRPRTTTRSRPSRESLAFRAFPPFSFLERDEIDGTTSLEAFSI